MRWLRDQWLGPGIAAAFALAIIFAGHVFAQGQATGPIPSAGAGAYGPPISTSNGHISYGNGAPPTLGTGCGTGPSIVIGTDSAARFTTGTSTSNPCTVTFATPWNQPPICSVTGTAAASFMATTSAVNITNPVDSQAYHVKCTGRPGG